MNESLLRLFKGYLGEKDETVSAEALKYGILISDNVNKNILKEAIKQYGKDGFKLNQTFHKDLEIVKNAPIEHLITQQIIHYITTYGFEKLGIYNNETVYIPKEKLEVPELEKDVELICINALTEEEISSKISVLINSGIALSKQTICDIMTLSDFIYLTDIDNIKNRELKLALYDKYNLVPKDPDEFLKYLIFELIGETLKIQNKETFFRLKNSDRDEALKLLNNYIENDKNEMAKLASIFLRNKKLFLALKTNNEKYKEINSIINKIKKLSSKGFHKPMPLDILNSLENSKIDLLNETIIDKLDKATIFREIRILNGLKYRLKGENDVVYRIRNGKSFADTREKLDIKSLNVLNGRYNLVYSHLINRLSKLVKGKTIYIPNNVVYKAPTSEKQFNGNYPNGSYIEIPKDDNIIYGIHWNNLKTNNPYASLYFGEKNGEERVDLDLHQMNNNSIFGWDSSYRSLNRDVLFTGDITNAPLPNGASEMFYISKNCDNLAFLITLNVYTNNSKAVPFEFFIAKTDEPIERRNYVVDPNNILEKINMSIDCIEKQKVLGLIKITDKIRLYLNDFSNGKGATTRINDNTTKTFNYLNSYNDIQLNLKDLLKDAGALIVNKPLIRNVIFDENNNFIREEKAPVDIDLSLNAITKESLIKLFIGD